MRRLHPQDGYDTQRNDTDLGAIRRSFTHGQLAAAGAVARGQDSDDDAANGFAQMRGAELQFVPLGAGDNASGRDFVRAGSGGAPRRLSIDAHGLAYGGARACQLVSGGTQPCTHGTS